MVEHTKQQQPAPPSDEAAAKQSDEAAAKQSDTAAATPKEKQQTDATKQEEQPSLPEQIEQQLTQIAELQDTNLRLHAEMQNVRRSSDQAIARAHKFALDKFVIALLPAVDSFELALLSHTETANAVTLLEGNQLTLKMLVDALEKNGVTTIQPEGEQFDPQQHEAMTMQPDATVPPNQVLTVVQKGYSLNDRLIRPARVIVSKAAD